MNNNIYLYNIKEHYYLDLMNIFVKNEWFNKYNIKKWIL